MAFRTMLHPLRFRPTVSGTLTSLLAWTALALVVLVVLAPLMGLVGRLVFYQPWDGRILQGQSSILIGSGEQRIHLPEESLACSTAKAGRQVVCSTEFEGAILETTVVGLRNEAGAIGALTCRARYADQQLTCEAAHHQQQMGSPHVIVHSDLGLSPERFQQLSIRTQHAGWSEADWLRLHIVLTVLVALALIEHLWWSSRTARPEAAISASNKLRLVYAFGGSIPLTVAFYLSSLVFLLSIGVLD